MIAFGNGEFGLAWLEASGALNAILTSDGWLSEGRRPVLVDSIPVSQGSLRPALAYDSLHYEWRLAYRTGNFIRVRAMEGPLIQEFPSLPFTRSLSLVSTSEGLALMIDTGSSGIVVRTLETGADYLARGPAGELLVSQTPATMSSSPLGGYWLVVDGYGPPSSSIQPLGWMFLPNATENDPLYGGVASVFASPDLRSWSLHGSVARTAAPDTRDQLGVAGATSTLLLAQSGRGGWTAGGGILLHPTSVWHNGVPVDPVLTHSSRAPSIAFGRSASPTPTCAKLILGDLQVRNPDQYAAQSIRVRLEMTYLDQVGRPVASLRAPEWDAPTRQSEPVPDPRCWVIEIVTSERERLEMKIHFSDGVASSVIPIEVRLGTPVDLALNGSPRFSLATTMHIGAFGNAVDPTCTHVSLR